MRPQVISLFDMEYGAGERFERAFSLFYEDPFQKDRAIRIVALDGERVAGFQAFFYWPISVQGRVAKSYQSGNSLVHPEYRGRGIFAGMLNFIADPEAQFDCDFLIGFPVEASYNSFLRNQWKNPLDLQWYVRLVQPVRAMGARTRVALRSAFGDRSPLNMKLPDGIIAVSQSEEFDAYRFSFQRGDYYRYFTENSNTLFEMKYQVRNRFIKELVIGRIIPGDTSADSIERDLVELEEKVRATRSVSLISVAANPYVAELASALKRRRYKSIDKKIHMIVKGNKSQIILDPDRYWIFRGDIDTW